jgi:mannobiose 2-epimerase
MTPSELKHSARQVLEDNILRFWSERMVDNERGGFYGRIDGHNILHKDAEKGAVLHARILWTFSSACRILHRMPYRILAARAKEYFLVRFIDPQYGGVYWSLHADGTPSDTKKQTYAIAFAIYGLTEYHRATSDQEALDVAIRLFEDLEAHAFDAVNVGYIEALTRDWQPIADMRLSESDENGSRTMNTHLHVLEAYTNLYRVLKGQGDEVQRTKERVARQLRVLIDIFTYRLFNPETGHLRLFFDDEWKPLNDKIEKCEHKFSSGHDIEAAWLLREAVNVLNGSTNDLMVNVQMVNSISHSLAQTAEDGILQETQWWCYAEAVVGYIDQWQLLLKKEPVESSINYEMAQAAYNYIQTHLLDREHGEWFWSVLPDGTPDRKEDKAGFWKCPYHNSRMCYELIERL